MSSDGESRHLSSSEEEEDGAVTSLDEALRSVNADRSQQDFLRENYETLGESCSSKSLPQKAGPRSHS